MTTEEIKEQNKILRLTIQDAIELFMANTDGIIPIVDISEIDSFSMIKGRITQINIEVSAKIT